YRALYLDQSEYAGAIALAHAGDGSTSTNGFWSALNIAAPLRLPYVMLIEDNRYALSVPWRYQTAAASIADNLSTFQGLTLQSVEGSDIPALYAAISSAIAAARTGSAQLVHVKVPRLTGHNWQDPAAYKSAEEKEEDARRDPVPRLAAYLQEFFGISAARL